jgi:organic hydroperoxide reductase OsmC/OhrA
MHPFPHHYRAAAGATPSGSVRVTTESAAALDTTAPPEFGGPPGYWSPETLLVAAVADCYILSFRAVAAASRLEWQDLQAEVEGVLDRVDGVTQFVSYTVTARLLIGSAAAEPLARGVLDKAKRTCLVTNSLRGHCELAATVTVADPAVAR